MMPLPLTLLPLFGWNPSSQHAAKQCRLSSQPVSDRFTSRLHHFPGRQPEFSLSKVRRSLCFGKLRGEILAALMPLLLDKVVWAIRKSR
jgi:hypothetical protein